MKPILAQPAARAAAAIIATAAAVLLAAACSGSPPSTHSGAAANTAGSAASKQRAYASCMRSHGVANFPDPDSGGGFDKATLAQLAASNSQYRAANQICGHLLPAGSSGRTPAEELQEWSGMLKYARCMRAHGEPNWPDPTPYPPYPSDPTYMLPASVQPVPQTISKMEECLRLVPMNYAVGHIDNPSWQSAQQQMAGL
jgi:hypothetical protein